jgi:penicillin amidase
MDRGFQMIVLRLVAQGRLSEVLVNSKGTLEVDVLSRQLGFERDSKRVVNKLGDKAKKLLKAYADGVNMYFENNGRTMEMMLIGYQPEKWEITHSLMLAKIMSYFGLAQTQQDIEKWIIQVIQKAGDVGVKLLQRLYRPHLDGLNQELVELIKKVRIELPLVPDSVRYGDSIPKLLASNNWAVAGAKSVSGNPIYASDPHLEINQLPPIWYEFAGVTRDNYFTGITVPGMPLIVMGRSKYLAYGFR